MIAFFIALPTFLNLSLLLFFLYKNRTLLFDFLKKIPSKYLILLVLISATAFILRISIKEPRHFLFLDEFYYMGSAKNFISQGNFGNLIKSFGWPSIITILFAIFGISNWVAIYGSIFFGSITCITIFLLIVLIFEDKYIATLSTFIFALMPSHIFWSATAETTAVSVFFISLCLFLFFLYFKAKTDDLLYCALLAASFSAQIRGENYLLLIVFFGFILFDKGLGFSLTNTKHQDIFFLIPALNFPNLLNLIKHEAPRLNVSYENATSHVIYFFNAISNGSIYTLPFLLLSIIGIFYLLSRNKRIGSVLLIFYAASLLLYFYWTNHEDFIPLTNIWRLYTNTFPVLLIWLSSGVFFLLDKAKITKRRIGFLIRSCLAIFLSAGFLRLVIEFPRNLNFNADHRLMTEIIEKAEKDLPKDSLIIANYPEVLTSTTFLNVIDPKIFLSNKEYWQNNIKKYPNVLFFDDYFCNRNSYPECIEKCNAIKSLFRLEVVKTYAFDLKNRGRNERAEFKFYRLLPNDDKLGR